MATDFNAAQWAQINAPRKSERDFNADFAEAVGTRDALRSGMSPNQAVLSGMRNRQAALDPMFQLKQAKMVTDIAQSAKQMQESILSSQIKKKQLDDEAADDLQAAKIIQQFGGDQEKMLQAINSTFWKSPKGIQNASQWRMQISNMRRMDRVSKIYSQLSAREQAQLMQFEEGSPEWLAKIEEFAPADNQPKGIAIQLPSGRSVEAVYNPKGGGYSIVADPQDKLSLLKEQLGAKEVSALAVFYEKEAAKLEAEAAGLERSTKEIDKRAAAELRSEAESYKSRLSALRQSGGQPTPPAAPENQSPIQLPKSKSDLIRGQVYSTSRGNAVWDGEKFIQQ